MKFYKVKKESDQIKFGKTILVSNEIFTEKEFIKTGLKTSLFDTVEIKKNNTYWFFGARFEKRIVC